MLLNVTLNSIIAVLKCQKYANFSPMLQICLGQQRACDLSIRIKELYVVLECMASDQRETPSCLVI